MKTEKTATKEPEVTKTEVTKTEVAKEVIRTSLTAKEILQVAELIMKITEVREQIISFNAVKNNLLNKEYEVRITGLGDHKLQGKHIIPMFDSAIKECEWEIEKLKIEIKEEFGVEIKEESK